MTMVLMGLALGVFWTAIAAVFAAGLRPATAQREPLMDTDFTDTNDNGGMRR